MKLEKPPSLATSPAWAILLALMSPSCALLTPFEISPEPTPADGDADVDSDGDADGDGSSDADVRVDAEADAEPDIDPFEGGIGCTGEAATEERWVVSVWIDDELRSYRTEPECRDPELLCRGCTPVAISPTGKRAVAIVPGESSWPLNHELAIVDLTEGVTDRVEHLGIKGARPNWVDAERFTYAALMEGTSRCTEKGTLPDRNDIRLRDLSTDSDVVLLGGTKRTWWECCPVYDEGTNSLLIPMDYATVCEGRDQVLTTVDLDVSEDGATAHSWTREWTGAYVFGLLPNHQGALLQILHHTEGPSRIYVMLWGGATRRVYTGLSDVGRVSGIWHPASDLWDDANDRFGECVTVRRLGPACEFYCRGTGDDWMRLTALGDEPEPVTCEVEGQPARIMDVWSQ